MISPSRFACVLCSSLLASAAPSPPTFISASSPLVLWSGRPSLPWADGSIGFDWEGTSASFVVSGLGSSVTLLANLSVYSARVSVFVNDYDAANLMLSGDAGAYLLAATLPAASNNVTVRFAYEPIFSHADAAGGLEKMPSFFGFTAGSGGAFAPPPRAARRLDIVGDSITAGTMYDKLEAVGGPLSLGEGCHPWAPPTGYSDSYSWASYLCRAFSANCTTTAWSGKGLIHNSACSAGPLMPQLYTQNFGTGPQPWDFARASRPDAVIVYLGTNDYSVSSAAGGPLAKRMTGARCSRPARPNAASSRLALPRPAVQPNDGRALHGRRRGLYAERDEMVRRLARPGGVALFPHGWPDVADAARRRSASRHRAGDDAGPARESP